MKNRVFFLPGGGAWLMGVFIWLASIAAGHSQTNRFAAGVVAYEARDFALAAQLFREELKHSPSAEAWRNLGLSEWQQEPDGAGILAWERALWLNPFDAEAAASLRFARQSAQLGEFPLRWWETFSTLLPARVWAWLAAGSFWLALGLAFVWPVILGRRRSAWTQLLAAVAVGILLLTITGAIGIHTRSALGVVQLPATPLRQTPTQHAQILAKLAAGEMARVYYRRGNYFYLRTSSSEWGWLETTQLQFIARYK